MKGMATLINGGVHLPPDSTAEYNSKGSSSSKQDCIT